MFLASVNQNVRRFLPASDYCRVHSNEIVEYSSDNETVLDSSWKLGGAAKHLIDGGKKRICRLRNIDIRIALDSISNFKG